MGKPLRHPSLSCGSKQRRSRSQPQHVAQPTWQRHPAQVDPDQWAIAPRNL